MDEVENCGGAIGKILMAPRESTFHSDEYATMRLVLIRYCNSAWRMDQEGKKRGGRDNEERLVEHAAAPIM